MSTCKVVEVMNKKNMSTNVGTDLVVEVMNKKNMSTNVGTDLVIGAILTLIIIIGNFQISFL
jgi:hypothetical protein